MASTALTTFRLKVPPETQTVDVLGSWDNFQETYPLRQDREAGDWRGCHRFNNIICDGHHLDPSAGRDGALKMGGTYWYYYQLNGHHELHDPVQPSTTHCPLLPGQRVNVLEVPIQLQVDDSQYSSSWKSSISAVFTLDPKAKYKSPRSSVRSATPDPMTLGHSKDKHRRCRQAGEPPQSVASDCSETSQGLCVSLPKASSWIAMLHRMRRLRSAPSTLTKDKAFQRKRPDERRRGATVTGLPTHRKLQVPATQPLYNRFKVPPCTPDRAPTISLYASNGSPAMEPQTSDFRPFDLNASHAEYRGSSLDLAGLRISSPRGVDSQSLESPKKALDIASPQSGLTKMKPHLGSMYKDAKKNDSAASVPASTSNSRDGSQVIRSAASPLLLPIQSNAVAMDNSTYAANCAMTDSTPYGLRWPPSLLYHSEETLTALYMHNAAFGSPLSPHYLSQPETPSIRDFDETWALESIDSQNDALENAVGDSPGGADSLLQLPKLPGSCLSVYHLPEGDHTSAPTLQKMPPAQGLALPENDAKNLVQSWDDGFFQQDEARGDYPLTDLGYLGQAII